MKTLKHPAFRLLSVILALAMLITTVPIMTFAEDESAPEYIYYGTYNSKPLKWQVLSNEGGKLLLITVGVLAKATKFNATSAVVNFDNSTIFTTLNTDFVNSAFSVAEKAKLINHDVTYDVWDGSKTTKTTSALVTLPSVADVSTYGLTKAPVEGGTANCNYWLADSKASSATDKLHTILTSGGTIVSTQQPVATSNGYRPVIMLAASGVASFTATPGITYTNTNGDEISKATLAVDAEFKVTLGSDYSQSTITVKAGDTVLTASTTGVYTIPAGTEDKAVTVEGVTPNPADTTAYDAAVAQTKDLVEDNYTAESWKDLQDALKVDISDCMADEQSTVDDAATAITTAFNGLELKPADLEAYNAAFDRVAAIRADSAHYSLGLVMPGGGTESYAIMLLNISKKYPKATVTAYKITDQDKVDEATDALNAAADMVPVKTANIQKWLEYIKDAETLDATKYMNVADYQARVKAIVEEHNYETDTVNIFHQSEVDESAARIYAILQECTAETNFIPTDFTALGAAIEKAEAYLEENYYKDDEMEGGTIAWEELQLAIEKGKKYYDNQELYSKKFRDQGEVDDATLNLEQRMATLDEFVRLTNCQKIKKSIKEFFAKLVRNAKEVIAILKTVNGLLKMLFNGEIDLYSLFETIGVDNPKLYELLEKLGFKRIEVPDPTIETPKA